MNGVNPAIVCRHISYLVHLDVMRFIKENQRDPLTKRPRNRGFSSRKQLQDAFTPITDYDQLKKIAYTDRPVYTCHPEGFGESLKIATARMPATGTKSLLMVSDNHMMHITVRKKSYP